MKKALRLADRRWRKLILGSGATIDRKFLEIFLILETKNRLAAGEIWIRGSRAYRAIDEHMISKETFAIIKADAQIPVAIPTDVEAYLAERSALLDCKLREAANRLMADQSDTRIGAKGLRVPAVSTTETAAALAFAKRLAGIMPHIRLTDLVADVDRYTGFSSQFEHLQTGRTPSDLRIFYAALIAEATNLGLSKMAQACPGITRRQLQQMAIWHFREDSFCARCGSSIGYYDEGIPDEYYITIGFFDHPERFQPHAHGYWKLRLPWIEFADKLPRFDEYTRKRDPKLGNPNRR